MTRANRLHRPRRASRLGAAVLAGFRDGVASLDSTARARGVVLRGSDVERVSAVALSSDGTRALVSHDDGRVVCWDLKEPRELISFSVIAPKDPVRRAGYIEALPPALTPLMNRVIGTLVRVAA